MNIAPSGDIITTGEEYVITNLFIEHAQVYNSSIVMQISAFFTYNNFVSNITILAVITEIFTEIYQYFPHLLEDYINIDGSSKKRQKRDDAIMICYNCMNNIKMF